MDLFEKQGPKNESKKDQIIKYSAAAGISITMIGILLYVVLGPQIGGALIILGVLSTVMPYGSLTFLENRRMKEMEDQFPAFLNGLAESKRGGMTLLDAFESAHNTDYGRLNGEVEQVYNELSWGIPFPKVMESFSERVSDSAVMQNSISIILQSYKSGGNITHTIDSVADEAATLRKVVKQKNSELKQQMLIMYVIYLLFIGITLGLYMMLDQLLGFGAQGGGAFSNVSEVTGSEGGKEITYCTGSIPVATPFCEIAKVFGFIPADIQLGTEKAIEYGYGKMAYYKSLLFTMLMVQGVSTSAIAGKITKGRAAAGIKHALVMIPLAFIAFMTLVAPVGV